MCTDWVRHSCLVDLVVVDWTVVLVVVVLLLDVVVVVQQGLFLESKSLHLVVENETTFLDAPFLVLVSVSFRPMIRSFLCVVRVLRFSLLDLSFVVVVVCTHTTSPSK